jgi:hypothetical protein
MMGEISPAMALRSSKPGHAALDSMNLSKNTVVGAASQSGKHLVALAVDEVEAFCRAER